MVNIMVQWLLTGLVSMIHPFFVSVIEINHNTKEATVEISVRVFTEDLEKTLQKYTTTKLDMVNPADPAFLDKQISNYISKKLSIQVNGQPGIFSYVGHEIQKESVWSYFEIPKVSKLTKLEIDCTLLYDFEKAQSNIIHVKSGNKDKSYKLDNPNSHAEIAF
ncbi:MAG: hypothetical protein M0Q26_02460 [Chitinophagaceae bacterium]|nr:hypothetical protein [Chitinophagaceae bacterium]MDP1764882.1 hypothetical protein [Sediminibacterium sp.]MDP1812731.1 hypothetical protein [Sediminibacterium sp.]MDP3129627.1 hypothetical protein [Sediminibacterium sp.]MDP3666277.1 hypothetical protein [Sediminibacterium sp.]